MVGRGCCSEEGIRKDFLEDGWKNDYGKWKEVFLGRGENMCKSREAGSCCLVLFWGRGIS